MLTQMSPRLEYKFEPWYRDDYRSSGYGCSYGREHAVKLSGTTHIHISGITAAAADKCSVRSSYAPPGYPAVRSLRSLHLPPPTCAIASAQRCDCAALAYDHPRRYSLGQADLAAFLTGAPHISTHLQNNKLTKMLSVHLMTHTSISRDPGILGSFFHVIRLLICVLPTGLRTYL